MGRGPSRLADASGSVPGRRAAGPLYEEPENTLSVHHAPGSSLIGTRQLARPARLIHVIAGRLHSFAEPFRFNVDRSPLEIDIRHPKMTQLEVP